MISFPLPVKMPWIVKKMYPRYLWDKEKSAKQRKEIYLTFDDGPTPEITTWVLKTLKQYNAKASFFVIGDNVRKHPEILKETVHAGHTIGNHTQNHLNGKKTNDADFLLNVSKAQESILSVIKPTSNGNLDTTSSHKFFRPPYGMLSRKQGRQLQKEYTIVLYDVLAYDWDHSVSASTCAKNVISNAKPGSIVLLHDSLKAARNLKECLPRILSHYASLGYTFKAL